MGYVLQWYGGAARPTPFINGGTLQYDPFHGYTKSAVSIHPPAVVPTVTTLWRWPNYDVLRRNESGLTNKAVEIYTVGSGWSTQYTASCTPPLYPHMHLLPNGKAFYSGSGTTSMLIEPSAHTWTTVAATIYSGTRTYGTSFLLPLTPANNYDAQVIIIGGANGSSAATATTEIIDLRATTPAGSRAPT